MQTGQPPVLAEQEADFPLADVLIARRHIPIWTDVGRQARHEGLAEAHDFTGRTPFRIEVRATLGTAQRQAGQRALVGLLQRQEAQRVELQAALEAQAALVGAEQIGMLDPPAALQLHLALIVLPFHSEGVHRVRQAQAFEQAQLAPLLTRLMDRHEVPRDAERSGMKLAARRNAFLQPAGIVVDRACRHGIS